MFKFGTIGLFGTNREKAFYKIVASVSGKEYVFNKPDWNAINPTIWRLKEGEDDFVVEAKNINF